MPASHFGAGWHDVLYTALILLYMKLKHALLRCDLIYLFDVDLTQMLNVYGSALQYIHMLNIEPSQVHQMVLGRLDA